MNQEEENLKVYDMPKLLSPFVRKVINEEYVVTPEVTPEYEWVFAGGPEKVLATEKLDGTDVSLIIVDGKITRIFNRTGEVPVFNKGKGYIVEGVLEAWERGYCDGLKTGQYFGEVIGPKLALNPYQLEKHLWVPFNTFCRKHLTYKSWHKYPKTFENIQKWFMTPPEEGGIFSLFVARRHSGMKTSPEGVVFHNVKTGQMSKLRLDMFPGFKGKKHKEDGDSQ